MKAGYCLTNLVAGAFIGYMNEAEININHSVLGLIIGSHAGFDGNTAVEQIKRENLQLELDNTERRFHGQEEIEAKNKDPEDGYAKVAAKSAAVYSACTLVGYGIGYAVKNVIG